MLDYWKELFVYGNHSLEVNYEAEVRMKEFISYLRFNQQFVLAEKLEKISTWFGPD